MTADLDGASIQPVLQRGPPAKGSAEPETKRRIPSTLWIITCGTMTELTRIYEKDRFLGWTTENPLLIAPGPHRLRLVKDDDERSVLIYVPPSSDQAMHECNI
jgi:hypothetical protein